MRCLHVMLAFFFGMTAVPFCFTAQVAPEPDAYGRTSASRKDEAIRSVLRDAVRAGVVGTVKKLIENLSDDEITRRIGLYQDGDEMQVTAWASAVKRYQYDVLKLFIPYLNDIALAQILREITMYPIPDKIKEGREEIARLIYSKTKYHTLYDAIKKKNRSPYDIIIEELERAVVDGVMQRKDVAYLVEAKKLLKKISYEGVMGSCTVDVLQYNLATINADIARNEGILTEEVFCPTCKVNYLRYVNAGRCPTCHQGETHAQRPGSVEERINDARVKKAIIEALLAKSGQDVKQPQEVKRPRRPAAVEEHKDPVPASVQAEWSCPSCTYLNSNAQPICEMCGTKRPPVKRPLK